MPKIDNRINYYTTRHPVVFLTFIRHEIASTVLSRIRDNRPLKLYLFSDGPRTDTDKLDLENIRSKLVKIIDWDCELRTFFLDHNKGVYHMWRFVCDTVFSYEESMIFLQEDLLPSNSFFRYCDEMLDFYESNHSIYMITGMNYLGEYNDLNEFNYFFEERNTTLGIAFWKRTYLNFIDTSSSVVNNLYYRTLIEQTLRIRKKNHWISEFQRLRVNRIDEMNVGEEFDLMGVNPNILFNQLAIIPKVNLIKHIGFDKDSENMSELKTLPKKMRMLDEMELYELEFPNIYHEYTIVDENYKKLLLKKFPKASVITRLIINIERAIRIFVYLGPKIFFNKLINYLRR